MLAVVIGCRFKTGAFVPSFKKTLPLKIRASSQSPASMKVCNVRFPPSIMTDWMLSRYIFETSPEAAPSLQSTDSE